MIDAIVSNIYNDINQSETPSISLLSGKAGVMLFDFIYAEYEKDANNNTFQNSIELLAENSLSYSYPTLCSGFTGINWFFKFLNKKNVLSNEDRSMLCYRDKELEGISLEMLKLGNYDFLHGAVGIAYYLLYPPNETSEEYYFQFFFLLNSLIDKSTGRDAIPNYDFETNRIIPNEINLGLSHGIPSILKFCLQCIKQNVCINKSERLARQIINYLLSHTNADTTHTYFSYSVSPEKKEHSTARLAWCYGDLGVGIVLYQAGIALQDKELIDFSLKVLLNSTKRKTIEDSGIVDAGICHGTAGAAHIYNRMWCYTQNPVFKEACDYWIQKTIDFSVHTDGVAGYKKYNGLSKFYENDCGLLEGATGIGLVLLSYLTGDFSWDYCLMLND